MLHQRSVENNNFLIATNAARDEARDPLRGLDYFVARTDAERKAIFALRYASYTDRGLISENQEGLLYDGYDSESDSNVFGVTLRGELVSTIRLGILSNRGKNTATYCAFRDYLDPIISSGVRIADGSRLAVRCLNSSDRRRIILFTLKLAVTFAAKRNAHRGIISVRSAHIPFYRRFGFEQYGRPRPYVAMLEPQSLMMIELDTAQRDWLSAAPQLEPSALDVSRLSSKLSGNMAWQ